MKNIGIMLAITATIVVGGFFLLNNYIYTEKQGNLSK